MSVLDDLAECFDERGCTGLTIWLDRERGIQINMRGPDNVSWDCHTLPDFKKTLTVAVGSYLARNGLTKPRITKKRHRDDRDLI